MSFEHNATGLLRPETHDPLPIKKPTYDERQRMCVRKRRYSSQGEALNAAMLAGVERRRQAYLCPICKRWHLSSA